MPLRHSTPLPTTYSTGNEDIFENLCDCLLSKEVLLMMGLSKSNQAIITCTGNEDIFDNLSKLPKQSSSLQSYHPKQIAFEWQIAY